MRGKRHSRDLGDGECGACGPEARERAIARLATKQKGAIIRAQLLWLGLSRHAVDRRLKQGRLQPMYRGVYLVGHRAAPPGAWEMAAVLACGIGAVASHRTAGHLWQLLPWRRGRSRPHERPERHQVDITVPGRDPGPKPGIRIHRVRALDPADVHKVDGIPTTSVPRTILDLSAVLGPRELEQALAEAHARRLVRHKDLLSLLARRPRARGARRLRDLLERDEPPALTRSEAEERLLTLIRRAELPPPETNVRVGPYEVDFLWREHRLIVEVDGFAFHSSREAFERDRARDAELLGRGFRVLRVTWRQIITRQEATLARICGAL